MEHVWENGRCANTMGIDRQQHLQGWMCSLVVHGILIMLTLSIGARIRFSPPPEPFRWNVALVSPSTPSEPPADVSAPSSATPLAPAPEGKPSQAASPPRQVEQSRSTAVPPRETRRVEAASQPTNPPPAPAASVPQEPALEQTIKPQSPTVLAQRFKPPAPADPPPAEAPQTSVTMTPTQEPTADVHPVVRPALPEAIQAETSSRHADAKEEVSRPPQEKSAPPVLSEDRSHSQAAESRPTEVTPQSQAEPSTTPQSAHQAEPSTAGEPTAAEQAPSPPVASKPPDGRSPVRRDYGWIRDAVARRIMELKHYPAQARLNHWEGKVVLRAVIRSDGHLVDLIVKQTSGYRVLDEAAMEVVRRICPIPLKYELGRSEIIVMIPIDYKLD